MSALTALASGLLVALIPYGMPAGLAGLQALPKEIGSFYKVLMRNAVINLFSVSFCFYNTKEEIDQLVQGIIKAKSLL